MFTDTPCVIQIFSKSGNLLTVGTCNYNDIDQYAEKIKDRCKTKEYTYKITVPHTPYSLLKWLEI